MSNISPPRSPDTPSRFYGYKPITALITSNNLLTAYDDFNDYNIITCKISHNHHNQHKKLTKPPNKHDQHS
jgi:hypothetical protein